ncbi:MAG: DUF177 domain-containing protein [Muribaculaceae bacterium]|nr:DUF177 domain-containing protein [Muribaculaceae bacterium]
MHRFNANFKTQVASFNLKLGSMVFGSETFKYHLDAAFFNEIGQSEVRGSDVDATVTVDRKREDYFELKIECSGTLVIACDRCLDDLEHEVETTYEIGVKLSGTDYDDSRDELLIIPESWRELDVAPLVRDTVLLTIPMTHVHAHGECNREMESLLSDHAAEGLNDAAGSETAPEQDENVEGNVDPRWAALLKLKENN